MHRPPDVPYSDPTLTITAHVDPTQPEEVPDFNYHRTLDCIKITAASPDAHFIQFVTRQYPDLFTYGQNGTFSWAPVQPYYMSDALNPRWKLDVTKGSVSCFYDECGLKKIDASSTHMYDDPSGSMMPQQDRAAFCTFVMVNDKITHLVQWSLEFTAESKDASPIRSYSVNVEPWDNKPLPLWAIKIVDQHYSAQGAPVPANIASQELVAAARSAPPEQLEAESRSHFLQAPPNWLTRLEFVEQFPEEFPQRTARVLSQGTMNRAKELAAVLEVGENTPLLPQRSSTSGNNIEQQPAATCIGFISKCCSSLFRSSPEEAAPRPDNIIPSEEPTKRKIR
jgi:hypothetical protein